MVALGRSNIHHLQDGEDLVFIVTDGIITAPYRRRLSAEYRRSIPGIKEGVLDRSCH